MSDWDDFCRNVAAIDPNDPQQFEDWLARVDGQQPGARIALPSRELLAGFANAQCARCGGTGYLGRYRWNCDGRCFACLPGARWVGLLQQLVEASRRAGPRD